MNAKLKAKLNSDKELTKSEWDQVLWGDKPAREPKYGTRIVKTGKVFRFGKKFAKK